MALGYDTLIFVEARNHTAGSFGAPEESITPKKAPRLRLLADHYRSARAHLDRLGGATDVRIVENIVEDG